MSLSIIQVSSQKYLLNILIKSELLKTQIFELSLTSFCFSLSTLYPLANHYKTYYELDLILRASQHLYHLSGLLQCPCILDSSIVSYKACVIQQQEWFFQKINWIHILLLFNTHQCLPKLGQTPMFSQWPASVTCMICHQVSYQLLSLGKESLLVSPQPQQAQSHLHDLCTGSLLLPGMFASQIFSGLLLSLPLGLG